MRTVVEPERSDGVLAETLLRLLGAQAEEQRRTVAPPVQLTWPPLGLAEESAGGARGPEGETEGADAAGPAAPWGVQGRYALPPLHLGQRRVAESTTRFRVIAAGRRWGKTRLGALLCIETALRGGRAWWVAPSYPLARIGWRELRALGRQVRGVEPREGDLSLEFTAVGRPSNGWVQVKSADTPGALRGEGLDFVVVDEAAWVREESWLEELRPALSDRSGRALFISTPRGQNWFWELWRRGHSGDSAWQSWQLPSSDNPFLAATELDQARRLLPERVWAQEYLADFVKGVGGPFFDLFQAVDEHGAPWHVWPWALARERYAAAPVGGAAGDGAAGDGGNGPDPQRASAGGARGVASVTVWRGGVPVEHPVESQSPVSMDAGAGPSARAASAVTAVFPPRQWLHWAAVDGGLHDPHCVLFAARAPDRRILVYREHYGAGIQVPDQARALRRAAEAEGLPLQQIRADPAMFSRRAHLTVSDAEIYAQEGVQLTPASNQREPGWRRVLELLATTLDDGYPQLVVLESTCPHLLRTLPRLRADELRPEDIADRQEDHAADALRYLCVPAAAPPHGRRTSVYYEGVDGPPAA